MLLSKKKILGICTSALILSTSFLNTENVFAATRLHGDVNQDGNVNLSDLVSLCQYIVKDIELDEIGLLNADTTMDGFVSVADLALLKQYTMGDTVPNIGTTFEIVGSNDNLLYYASDAIINQAITETVNAGYSGSSYVNYDNVAGSSVEWTVNVTKSGLYKLNLKYANGTAVNRPLRVTLNASTTYYDIDFNGTGAWTTWSENFIVVNLNQGQNKIKALATTENGGPNVDYLKLESTSESATPISGDLATQTTVVVPNTETSTTTITTSNTTAVTTTTTTTAETTITTTQPPIKDGAKAVEKLGRGLIATQTSAGMLVNWRFLGTDDVNTTFKLYKDGNLIYTSGKDQATSFLDTSGSTSSKYTVETVVNNTTMNTSSSIASLENGFMEIPLNKPSDIYSPNDASVADVDGDGEYEIILKWDPSDSKDNSQEGITSNVFIDCYKLNGTRLWRIDLGRNIRAGAHYTQFMVYDFDGDGKAEMICKTADATKDGKGTIIGNSNADYRNTGGYILSGPEYLTVFNGETGAAMKTIDYNPARGTVSSWGDNYGNRVDRFLAGVAYLDGQNPSAIICRGYYTRAVLVAYDWDGKDLKQRWIFDSNVSGNGDYAGQGNHNLSTADVDGDNRQEIIYGSCVIDDNGKGLYSTKLGHGDALHVSDFLPDRSGLEIWKCNESSPFGSVLLDAKTGSIIFRYTAEKDTGRAAASNIWAGNNGSEFWGSSGAGLYDSTGKVVGSTSGISTNFLSWWDGDLERELLDGYAISKYNGNGVTRLLTATGCAQNNGTKANPSLSADIFGDWREELIMRTEDNNKLRIYSTTYETKYRLFTLMHDPQYRTAIAWQNVAYNQPPHPGFYLGSDKPLPSMPNVYAVK